jgi:DNA primase
MRSGVITEDVHMTTATFIDFAELKARVGIHQVMQLLGLDAQQKGSQFRCHCPVHGGDRALIVTPAHKRKDGTLGSFFCQVEKKGGDSIGLAAHVRGLPPKEAAKLIADHFGTVPVTSTGTVTSTVSKKGASAPASLETAKNELQPLEYLQAEHEAVEQLGLTSEACTAFGAGYAPKGILRGRLAIPIHDPSGEKLLAYCGRAVGQEEPRLAFPKNFDPATVIWNAHRVSTGDFVYLTLDPLEALKAFDSGVENVVACLGVLNSDFLQALSIWMDEKQIVSIEPM